MSPPGSASQKNDLRRRMRAQARLTPVDPAALAALAAALDTWIASHPEVQRIATFHPLADEPDLGDIASRHPGRSWLYPRLNGPVLSFHAVASPAHELVPGAFGILEPAGHLSAIPIGSIDAFLCPGLAFDRHGGRLGRGMGYYDRSLAQARPDARKIGICLPHQIVPDTFSEPHDIHMDLVLSGRQP